MTCTNANTPASLITQDDAEAAVLCLVNEQRAANGVAPLTLNLRLRAAARLQANDARAIKWWAGGGPQIHINPVTHTKPEDRIKGAGYCPGEESPPMNENGYSAWYQGGIAFQGGTTPQAAVDWWMSSPGHRATLLDPVYSETGTAVVLGVAEQGPGPDSADGGVIVVQTFGGCERVEPAHLGNLWSWGGNDHGQLGDGSQIDQHRPVQPKGVARIVALAAGRAHSFALRDDGSVLAWGFNALGQLGDGTTTGRLAPADLTTISGLKAIAAGNSHSVALMDDGTLMAWGANHKGQIGDGTTTDQLFPVQIPGLADVVAISAGFNFNLALTSKGLVWAWGENNWGQLGDGTTDDRSTPVQVAELSGVVNIRAGFEYALAIRADRSVWGWGSNHSGQLGDGTSTQRHTPVAVGIPSTSGPIAAIAAGGFHSMALEQNGQVWTWGGNGYGQLGVGDRTDRWLPVRPVGVYDVAAIAAGFGHCLVLKQDGDVLAWGMNSYGGQVGDNTTVDRSTPVAVRGLPPMVGIVAGDFHTLAT